MRRGKAHAIRKLSGLEKDIPTGIRSRCGLAPFTYPGAWCWRHVTCGNCLRARLSTTRRTEQRLRRYVERMRR